MAQRNKRVDKLICKLKGTPSPQVAKEFKNLLNIGTSDNANFVAYWPSVVRYIKSNDDVTGPVARYAVRRFKKMLKDNWVLIDVKMRILGLIDACMEHCDDRFHQCVAYSLVRNRFPIYARQQFTLNNTQPRPPAVTLHEDTNALARRFAHLSTKAAIKPLPPAVTVFGPCKREDMERFVRQVIEMLEKWAVRFQHRKDFLELFSITYEMLRQEGVQFPRDLSLRSSRTATQSRSRTASIATTILDDELSINGDALAPATVEPIANSTAVASDAEDVAHRLTRCMELCNGLEQAMKRSSTDSALNQDIEERVSSCLNEQEWIESQLQLAQRHSITTISMLKEAASAVQKTLDLFDQYRLASVLPASQPSPTVKPVALLNMRSPQIESLVVEDFDSDGSLNL
eukprot:GILK01009053.1.p1 GENE.GILK01009053.1~~GILK01009053.1.p1  ORF type:complete len:416 (+),score=75.51 GILK01009053.1:47-1249(+)